jgi:outer membrane lipoprotein-sorting protein
MKNKIALVINTVCITCLIMGFLVGCTQAERASYNLSMEADNFNIVRRVTVIDCITGDTLFQMVGKLSIMADTDDNQLEITVEDDGTYQKHIIGLSDNVTYVIEDLNLGANDVSNYRYTINFNPKMWIPVDAETID